MTDYTVTELRSTSSFAPSRWEGQTASGENIHIRYRSGSITVSIGDYYPRGELIHEEELTEDKSHSHLTDAEMRDALSEVLSFA